jgi:hypothetical protein
MSRRRFPHTVGHLTHTGRDGQPYRITISYYTRALQQPGLVYMDMTIEGTDGTRRELRGDAKVRPVMERIFAQKHAAHTVDYTRSLAERMCDLCRQEIRARHATHLDGALPETCSICRAKGQHV